MGSIFFWIIDFYSVVFAISWKTNTSTSSTIELSQVTGYQKSKIPFQFQIKRLFSIRLWAESSQNKPIERICFQSNFSKSISTIQTLFAIPFFPALFLIFAL